MNRSDPLNWMGLKKFLIIWKMSLIGKFTWERGIYICVCKPKKKKFLWTRSIFIYFFCYFKHHDVPTISKKLRKIFENSFYENSSVKTKWKGTGMKNLCPTNENKQKTNISFGIQELDSYNRHYLKTTRKTWSMLDSSFVVGLVHLKIPCSQNPKYP